MALCGGFGENQAPTDEVHELVKNLKAKTEEKLGQTFNSFVATGFKSQVVAGTNFLVDVKADDKNVQVKIFRPLPHTGEPAQLTEANLV